MVRLRPQPTGVVITVAHDGSGMAESVAAGVGPLSRADARLNVTSILAELQPTDRADVVIRVREAGPGTDC